MRKELTCIGCPMGCQLTAVVEGNEVVSVEGNTCAKGASYAKKECIAPQRTVTSSDVYKRQVEGDNYEKGL